MGFSMHMYPFSLEVNLNLEVQAKLMPMQRSCNTPTSTMQTNGENAMLKMKNTWGTRTSRGIATIWRWHKPLGGHKLAVRPEEVTECFVGSFWALEDFFHVLPTYGMCNVLCGVTASACVITGTDYFFLIMFLGLKNRLCTYCSMKKPRHYF